MRPSSERAQHELGSIRRKGLHRSLICAKADGAYVKVGRRRLLNLSSNDYLALRTPDFVRARQSASSSRLLSGNDPAYARVESKLASHRSKPASLIFPTGYMANIGAICALAKKGDLILSDELNHASIIDACKLSGAKTMTYMHNDADDLDSKLCAPAQARFVISEGIFSMDGDVSDLRAVAEVAERHDASVILDDAHGDFVLGRNGEGTARLHRVARRIDVHISSLSKALGSIGGYVAAERSVIDMCVNRARTFIYTSALPRFAIEHIAQRQRAPKQARRKILARNTTVLHKALDSLGLGIDGFRTHIAPIVVGDERRAMRLGKRLYELGMLAQAVRYPTVALGSARIRLSITAWPTEDELGTALDRLGAACRRLGVA